MTRMYELIESLDPETMDKMLKGDHENIEPRSCILSSPLNVVKYILKTDLKEYKLVKKTRTHARKRISPHL